MIGYVNEADCTAAGGTWNLDRKWTDGWGLPDCAVCRRQVRWLRVLHLPHEEQQQHQAGDRVGGGAERHPAGQHCRLCRRWSRGAPISATTRDSHTTSNKVCEVCHSKTTYHRFDTTGQSNLAHNNKTDCVRCHEHNVGFRASCDSCHGTPPVSVGGLVTTDQNGPRDNRVDHPGRASEACRRPRF